MKLSTLNRVYIDTHLAEDLVLNITDQRLHYIKTVLRLKLSDRLRIFNELDGEFIARIVSITKNNLSIQVIKFLKYPLATSPLALGLAIIKSERFMQAINMAVQLGVTKIVPLILERSQYRTINNIRILKCVIEAVEQSERLTLPLLEPAINLDSYLKQSQQAFTLYANKREDHSISLLKILPLPSDITYIVGPEGGFSNAELQLLAGYKNARSFSLGPNILRTETAVVAGLSQINLCR